jgi:predicted DsbA family dithiol-disulfide isomerase
MWFDFNQTSLEVINNFNNAFERFKFASDIDVLFRSLPKAEINFKYHELFQYGRKKGFKHAYLCDVFKIYTASNDFNQSLEQLLKSYPLKLDDLKQNLEKHQSLKIVKNQMEHAALQKIDVAPTLTFTHGFRLVGLSSIAEIEATLIKMYEKDSGIKYCIEEDCER